MINHHILNYFALSPVSFYLSRSQITIISDCLNQLVHFLVILYRDQYKDFQYYKISTTDSMGRNKLLRTIKILNAVL